MAWNDPPKIAYDQFNSGGRKFKHRYVSPNLGQATNMLHQPVMSQQNDQFNYGLNPTQQQQTNNVSMNPVSAGSYPNHHMYQQQQQQQQQQSQQQTQQMQTQQFPINYNNNQFQNQDYQQQQAPPPYHVTPNGSHPPQHS